MTTTTDGVEIDCTTEEWEERVRLFLTTGKPLYVSDSATVVELIVAGIGADSRTEVMRLEETVTQLVHDNEIVLGAFERDDDCGFGRGSGPLVQRVIWVK